MSTAAWLKVMSPRVGMMDELHASLSGQLGGFLVPDEYARKIRRCSDLYPPMMGNRLWKEIAGALAEISEDDNEMLDALLHTVFVWGYAMGRSRPDG